MKQKIVIRVHMDCEKCRTKALKIAAGAKGVSSVALEGDHKDQVAVTGETVDSVCLAKALRKKFGHANILSVEEVKDKDKKKDENPPPIPFPWCSYPPYPQSFPFEHHYESSCIVM